MRLLRSLLPTERDRSDAMSKYVLTIAVLLGTLACSSKVEKLETDVRRLEGQLAAMQRSQAELSSRVEELSNAQFILEDKVDTNRQYISAVKKNQAMRIVQLQPQPALPASRAEPEPVKPPPPPAARKPTPSEPKQPVAPKPAKPERAQQVAAVTAEPSPQPVIAKGTITNPLSYYKQALGYYEEARWEECIDAFKHFADELPDHDYADNSLYWAGECYYSQDLYDDAISVFSRLVARYPGGNKAPDALLKVALSHRKLGDERKSKEAAQRLLDDYPFSDAAGKTQSLLGYPR